MNLYILFGQTATGKTKKAFELADQYNGEIINFDSRQIYKKLTIVTGKDTSPNLQHTVLLYDIVDPKEVFSSAEYVEMAVKTARESIARGKTPIFVGGTGHYLRHLIFGVPENTAPQNWELRRALEGKPVKELQKMLSEKNAQLLNAMNNSDRNNPRRLIRRIEIATSGQSLPELSLVETLTKRLGVNGTITYLPFFHESVKCTQEKITARVEERLQMGALDEVKNLLGAGYSKADPGLNAIGYKQLIAYLNRELSFNEAKKQWITAEVQYAKRQKTFFKKYFPKTVI